MVYYKSLVNYQDPANLGKIYPQGKLLSCYPLLSTASERHTKRQTFGAEILRQTSRQVQLGHKR